VACCLVQVRYEDLFVPATGSDAHLPEGNTSFLLTSLFLTPPPPLPSPPPIRLRVAHTTRCWIFSSYNVGAVALATVDDTFPTTKFDKIGVDRRKCPLGGHSRLTYRPLSVIIAISGPTCSELPAKKHYNQQYFRIPVHSAGFLDFRTKEQWHKGPHCNYQHNVPDLDTQQG
jgi:hypothetical protein